MVILSTFLIYIVGIYIYILYLYSISISINRLYRHNTSDYFAYAWMLKSNIFTCLHIFEGGICSRLLFFIFHCRNERLFQFLFMNVSFCCNVFEYYVFKNVIFKSAFIVFTQRLWEFCFRFWIPTIPNKLKII